MNPQKMFSSTVPTLLFHWWQIHSYGFIMTTNSFDTGVA